MSIPAALAPGPYCPYVVPSTTDGLLFEGRIAQLVEQLTLNQRVQGSSPCAPTIPFRMAVRSPSRQ